MVKQLELFVSGTWPSNEVISEIIYETLEDGPGALSVNELCSTSGYSAHSVRRTMRKLENKGAIQRVIGSFDRRGRPIFSWAGA